MDVVDSRADRVGVVELAEDLEELEVRLGRLNRDDIGVETDDVREDGVEVRVAEVGVCVEKAFVSGGVLDGQQKTATHGSGSSP